MANRMNSSRPTSCRRRSTPGRAASATRKIAAIKRNRRVEVGPYVTFYFESYDTMWLQVQEMVYIEKGGAAQLPDELAAYNPLIPKGTELTATFMIEIDDPAAPQARPGHARRHRGDGVHPHRRRNDRVRWRRPTRIAPRRRARRRPCSSCISRSRRRRSRRSRAPARRWCWASIIRNYGHMAVLPEAVRAELAKDFD